jgi:nucleotide-binding universal stress UspA family protein
MAHASVAKTAATIKHILFATDFSTQSAHAIPYIAAIAKHFGARVFATHIIQGEPRYEVPMDQLREEVTQARKDAEQDMAALLENTALEEMSPEVCIQTGDVWHELKELATNNNVDMIVVGTHGHGGVGKMVFGSVAEQIFRQANCPVLIVGPHVSDDDFSGEIQRILFATDLSRTSLAMLPFSVDLANAFGAFFKAVHVLHERRAAMLTFVPEEVSSRQKILQAAMANYPFVHEPEVMVENGAVADTILKTAATNSIDLIMMGAHKTGSASLVSHLPMSTTHVVASHACCPVLVVPSGN